MQNYTNIFFNISRQKIAFDKFFAKIYDNFKLEDAINFHKITVHSTARHKPIYLKDITDVFAREETKKK